MPSILYLLCFLLIIVGLLGLCTCKSSFIFFFIYIEIIMLGVGCLFCLWSCYSFEVYGYLIFLQTLTISAVEIAVGLSLLIIYYLLFQNTSLFQLAYYLKI